MGKTVFQQGKEQAITWNWIFSK